MCYSKEVSLVAGSAIFVSSLANIISMQLKSFLHIRKKACFLFLVLGYLAIGFHQVFEYFAILKGNDIVYKIGLMFSISAMFFNIKSSEYFFKKSLGSFYVLIILFLLALHIFTRDMVFENANFYVRGESHFYWGAIWMGLFLYWNFIHYFAARKLQNGVRTLSYWLPWCSLNISFFLATFYSYGFGLYQNLFGVPVKGSFCSGLLSNFEIVFDAPSIWCVFASIQGISLYFYSKKLFARDVNLVELRELDYKKALVLTGVVWGLIFLTLPMFSALSYKMILK